MNAPQAARTPFDVPPRNTTRVVHGLITHASYGEQPVELYTRPWSGDSSSGSAAFPLAKPSYVSPNSIRPTWGVAINAYSPVAHRNGLTTVTPPKAIPAGGIGTPTQRPRGYAYRYVTAWPQSAPAWPTWGEANGR